MKTISQYLTYNGQCKEAMTFYKSCFGGELNLMTFGQSPLAAQIPDDKIDWVMHSNLTIDGDIFLRASDNEGSNPFILGNNISLFVECNSDEELDDLFEKLSESGKVIMPVEQQFWGSRLGMLLDKFGVNWMLIYEKENVT
ncbi:MAG: VOC family protein [Bacteroidales bacterium]|nr:VOC family protein [Bacteroidales bacterium]